MTEAEEATNKDLKEQPNPKIVSNVQSKHLELDSTKQTLFVYYDSKNPLHQEFLKEVHAKNNFNRMLKKYPSLDVVLVDLSS